MGLTDVLANPTVLAVAAGGWCVAAALHGQRGRAARKPHTSARSQQNPGYPQRAAVEDSQVAWAAEFATYAPTAYENPKMVTAVWADKQDVQSIRAELETRVSHEGPIVFGPGGRPVNPRGRTGMDGRGTLGKWGPNHAADPIVTRYDPARPSVLQVVSIERKDTGAP